MSVPRLTRGKRRVIRRVFLYGLLHPDEMHHLIWGVHSPESKPESVPSLPWAWTGGYPQRITGPDATLIAEVYEDPDAPAVVAPLICEAVNAYFGVSDETHISAAVRQHGEAGSGVASETSGPLPVPAECKNGCDLEAGERVLRDGYCEGCHDDGPTLMDGTNA